MKKMHPARRPVLELRKETLTQLHSEELAQVAGGTTDCGQRSLHNTSCHTH